jgi:hypothetical protein
MSSQNIGKGKIKSARDMLLYGLESSRSRVIDTIADITEAEFHWETLSESERLADIGLKPDRKKVWRVYQKDSIWIYDYTPETLISPPFTTIAWIMNHIAQTGDMYLYCVKTGKPEGVDRSWDDLPVFPRHEQMSSYILQVLDDTRAYLDAITEDNIIAELNKLTPLPWGVMRPVYKNIWGGIITHTIEHAAQIAILMDRIRFGN